MILDELLEATPYSLTSQQRESALIDEMNSLSAHHSQLCSPYKNILDGLWSGSQKAECLADVPYLPVSLFKTHDLRSIEDSDVRSTFTSSGTTGQAVSKIYVDTQTSKNQQRGLANSLSHVLGKKRLPMMVLDTDAVFRNPQYMNARGAGVLGMMRFGRNHAYVLNEKLEPEFEIAKAFLEKHGDEPFFMFGFTFIVWAKFYQAFKDQDLDLSNGILIHSGGWKKMIEQSVDNTAFRHSFKTDFNLEKIHNFYGMVEQLGSIMLEGPDNLLYSPNFSHVIIRDSQTFEPVETGQTGIIQVLSILPKSYPGHSLLTEDLGVIEHVDNGGKGWNGTALKVLGRIPKAELRGCSDVIAQKQVA